MSEQGKSPIGEEATRNETSEERENRLWEEAEAKRRAEAAQRLREAAAESARRREEEDRLWEERVAKKIAEKEQRIREAAANPQIQEEQKRREEAEAKKRAAERRRQEEAEAKAKKRAEEQRLKQEAEAKRKAENARRSIEAEAKAAQQKAEENKKRLAEAEQEKRSALKAEQANVGKRRSEELQKGAEGVKKPEPSPQETKISDALGENGKINKKRIATIALMALLAVFAIWIFSTNNSDTGEEALPSPKIDANDFKDSEPETTTVETPKPVAASSKLEVGDTYEDGIVFAIDADGKTGQIAQQSDAGPMPWNEAMNIGETLGEGWRLPTFDELHAMYKTIGQGSENRGGFADELYWSATLYDQYQARLVHFRNGNTSYHYNKEVENRRFRVRAIRDFKR